VCRFHNFDHAKSQFDFKKADDEGAEAPSEEPPVRLVRVRMEARLMSERGDAFGPLRRFWRRAVRSVL